MTTYPTLAEAYARALDGDAMARMYVLALSACTHQEYELLAKATSKHPLPAHLQLPPLSQMLEHGHQGVKTMARDMAPEYWEAMLLEMQGTAPIDAAEFMAAQVKPGPNVVPMPQRGPRHD